MNADVIHYKSRVFPLLFTLVLTLSAAKPGSCRKSDRVLLSDVEALTLQEGKSTTARRTDAIPQLKCVGGSAQCKLTPKIVLCTNQGSDGSIVQWECKADIHNDVRFGQIHVTCEGYKGPNDTYILKGSCGLAYNLEARKESESLLEQILYIAFMMLLLDFIYRVCLNDDDEDIFYMSGQGYHYCDTWSWYDGGCFQSSQSSGGVSSGFGGTSVH